jgi:hypothetical protein
MSYEKKLLQEIRGELAKLPESRRHQVETIAASFRTALKAGGTLAAIALALVASEEAAQHEAELQ